MHAVHMWLIDDIQASLMLAWLQSISESILRHSPNIWAMKIPEREITAMFGMIFSNFSNSQNVLWLTSRRTMGLDQIPGTLPSLVCLVCL